MKIRERLTLQFSTIVIVILITFSISIYYVSKYNRYNAFRLRLKEKAMNSARLLMEVDQIDVLLLKKIRKGYLQALQAESVRMYDKNNTIIFKDDTLDYQLPENFFEQVRQNGEVDFIDGKRQFVAVTYKNEYIVIASAINIFGSEELKDLAYILVIANLICMIIIVLSGWFFSRQALKPISAMVSAVKRMGDDDLKLRLDEGKRKDEIDLLAITFNRLFDKIEDAIERKKRFVANASHELRTPLTTLTGEIEVALMKEREKEEYIQVLLSALEETKALTKLSNDLLKLTQTGDMKGLLIRKITIAELIQAIADENNKRNPNAVLNFDMPTPIEVDNFFVRGNLDLLKISILNVIENGYKFSFEKPVHFSVTSDDNFVHLQITDQGIGIKEDEVDLIFQPFYRSENVITFEGNGIGLSLTQRIIKIHDGSILVTSTHGKGTTVKISLKIEKHISPYFSK